MTRFILISYLLIICRTAHSDKKYSTCTTKEACIPFRECDAVNEILRKGNRLSREDSEYFRRIQCKVENRMAYVCCAKKINLEELLPKAPHCGIQFSERIFGGVETEIDEYPWTVQVQYTKANGAIYNHCGGVLINKRYVLTAAHCESRLPRGGRITQVRLGDWDIRTNPDCDEYETCNDPYVEIPIDKVIVHEDYIPHKRAQNHDIALIKLQHDVTFSKFIKPICLPIDLNVRNMELTNHGVEVAGFGRTENKTGSDRKMKVGVTITSQDFCQNVYRRSNIEITDKQLCAGGEPGKDSCKGDSGGPLMKDVVKPGSLPYTMLVGLVSFGPSNCGTKNHPGLYTRVSEYMDWITNNMD